MKKNLRFILLLIKFKLSHMIIFRLNFFEVLFADGMLFLIQLVTFETIYSRVDSIGGWTRGQMIVFVGTFSLINALNMMTFFFGIVDIPGKVKRGDLDQYLTKPVSPLLRLTFESVNPGSFPLVIFSVMVICYGAGVAAVEVSFGLVLGYTAMVLLMTLLWYDMLLILRSSAFLVLSVTGIHQLEDQLLELNFRVPGVFYRGLSKVVFYFVLPYGIMSTVPTQLIIRSIKPGELIAAIGTVASFTVFALWFWRFGLKHYKSASS